MFVATFKHVQDFLDRAQHALLEHEAENSLMLGIAFRLKQQPGFYKEQPYMATVEDDEGLILAALMTPPRQIILSSQRPDYGEALEALVLDLYNHQWNVPGVGAPSQLAINFAEAWQAQSGVQYRLAVNERLFSLQRVFPPTAVPGKLRLATQAEYSLLESWIRGFFEESHVDENPDQAAEYTQHRLTEQSFYVWELPDGQVVSLAGKTRPVKSVISVGPVYTPPAYRGKGYASNTVATLSQRLLDEGWKTISLFTDLSNPTSNSIYQKIGYDPVIDFDEYRFYTA